MVGADAAVNDFGRKRPVDPGVGLCGLAAEGGEGMVLELGGNQTRCPVPEGFYQQLAADYRQLFG